MPIGLANQDSQLCGLFLTIGNGKDRQLCLEQAAILALLAHMTLPIAIFALRQNILNPTSQPFRGPKITHGQANHLSPSIVIAKLIMTDLIGENQLPFSVYNRDAISGILGQSAKKACLV